jgi:hypothetical protein
MRAMVRVMVLRQIARTKSRAGAAFWGDAGNEGNQFQSPWKMYKIKPNCEILDGRAFNTWSGSD